MTRAVVFRPEAVADVLEVKAWYDERRAGLGDEFAVELGVVVKRIAEEPALFQRVKRELRRAVVARFPYAVYFRFTGTEVVVLAVHGRQLPRRWRRRT